MLLCVIRVIVLVLYCPVLHCRTLPLRIHPFAVDDDDYY